MDRRFLTSSEVRSHSPGQFRAEHHHRGLPVDDLEGPTHDRKESHRHGPRQADHPQALAMTAALWPGRAQRLPQQHSHKLRSRHRSSHREHALPAQPKSEASPRSLGSDQAQWWLPDSTLGDQRIVPEFLDLGQVQRRRRLPTSTANDVAAILTPTFDYPSASRRESLPTTTKCRAFVAPGSARASGSVIGKGTLQWDTTAR